MSTATGAKKKASSTLPAKAPAPAPPPDASLSKLTAGQYTIIAVSGVCGAVLALLLAGLSAPAKKPSAQTVGPSANGGWAPDVEFLRAHGNDVDHCDFPVINAKVFQAKRRKQQALEGLFEHPFVVRGMTTAWLAHTRWTKANFTALYGNRTIKLGSESSIVYGGGSAVLGAKLQDVVDRLRTYPSSHGSGSSDGSSSSSSSSGGGSSDGTDVLTAPDSFTFDVSVTKSIPEIWQVRRCPAWTPCRPHIQAPQLPLSMDLWDVRF